jgi:ABC-type multidrug transport system fused ATPase/permease subunit
LEVISIGVIGPFIALATNPKAIEQNVWLKTIYNQLHLTSEIQFLIVIGLVVVALFYVKAFVSFTAQKNVFEFGFSQQAELSARLMQAYLRAPYTFHLSRNSASLIQNINNETERFTNGLMMPLLTSISNSIIILALICLLLRTNVLAVVIIAIVLLLAFMIVYSLKDRLKRWGKESSEARTEIIRTINHGLGGLKETKVIGCEPYFESQMQKYVNKFGVTSALAVGFTNLPRFMIEAFLITFLILFTIIFVVSNQQDSQNLSSVLGIFALASIRLLPAINNVVTSITGIRYASFSLDQIYFDLKEVENLQEEQIGLYQFKDNFSSGSNGEILFSSHVSLEEITYRYPNAARSSLESVSLTLKKGQSIGLIGQSGAGKTTLVDVILGLLMPQSGNIMIDGVSIYSNIRSWQNLIGYVPQSIFLIDDTLEKNIAFGVPEHLIDRQRLLKAVEAAQLLDLIGQLPHQLKTKVGERGVLLSGGQRQRVGIARALYHEREILVFDEATAALDNETEALVTESIRSLSGIKTMIIIAHRFSTIEHCDCIYRLERGRVIQSGSYREVVLKA